MPANNSYEISSQQVTSRGATTERLERLRREALEEMGLFELRRAFARSQTDMAESLGVSQSAVSQFERGADAKLSTLRRYVEELGGDLRITARFGDGADSTEVPIDIFTNPA